MRWSLILLLFVSVLSHAEKYKRGIHVCTDYSEDKFKQDSTDLENQFLHASCLVIKGRDSEGLPMLYTLTEQHSYLLANYFLADYLATDGRFNHPFTDIKIDEALKYYMQTQATIKLMPQYPSPYEFAEANNQIELRSIYKVPYLYLVKYETGLIRSYCQHLWQSPSYKGDIDDEIHFKYNLYTRDSLDNTLNYAKACASLPQKEHFKPEQYKATKKACQLLESMTLNLIPLEEKRLETLRQNHCQDLNKSNWLFML